MDRNGTLTILDVTVYRDGTIHRAPLDPPPVPACPSPPSPHQVATDDLTLNAGHGTSLRLFKPPSSYKLPVLLYFHGGGFLCGSYSRPPDHSFLCKLAAYSRTLIVSVDYCLTPEHPLPAAYEDGIEALLWLGKSAALGEHTPHPWLTRYADFSNCFLGGDSAGANIAHHVATWMSGLERGSVDLGFGVASWSMTKAAACAQDMEGVCVRGIILIHPFFTCGAGTYSERELRVWKLSGVDTNHPFANPLCSSAPSLTDAALPHAFFWLSLARMYLLQEGLPFIRGLLRLGRRPSSSYLRMRSMSSIFIESTPRNVPLFLDELRDFINLQ